MTHQLQVDWPRCQARGLCYELLPEVVALDEWGYPVVTASVPDFMLPDAQAAVRACPRLALRLVAQRSTPPRSRPGASSRST